MLQIPIFEIASLDKLNKTFIWIKVGYVEADTFDTLSAVWNDDKVSDYIYNFIK